MDCKVLPDFFKKEAKVNTGFSCGKLILIKTNHVTFSNVRAQGVSLSDIWFQI